MANPFRRSMAGRTCLATSLDPIEVHLDLLIVRDGVAFKAKHPASRKGLCDPQLSTGYLSTQNESPILSSHPPSPNCLRDESGKVSASLLAAAKMPVKSGENAAIKVVTERARESQEGSV